MCATTAEVGCVYYYSRGGLCVLLQPRWVVCITTAEVGCVYYYSRGGLCVLLQPRWVVCITTAEVGCVCVSPPIPLFCCLVG